MKSQKIANNSAATEAREKNKHRFGISGILDIVYCIWLNLKTIKFYWIKLATDF